ncbi:UDP-N-acetylmuramate--L-alanine ligase [Francisella frigiditurris]|uniref:UDP-N-acetylmuramate--L-alanine ligase n=1 Tax=Francisella frigiditurris TaxID=1542390 RepID=A0A1J0KTM6_9GAMM|nr:UDP-N-acetylmuramate--L-alanine ligase [Francisella frigiditurris]APC97117.1 UDP-N-acetylmuramate--L-alanine ligase [Francisella frigiditurris]
MKKRILFLGVGGIGVSALAIAAKKLGAEVSGYDTKPSKITAKLVQKGINLYLSLDQVVVENYDMLVFSSAVSQKNPLILKAKELNIPTLQRAMFLAVLMKDFKQSIAVTGTHGKTTVSSVLATLLHHLDSKSSFVVGGIVKATGSNIEINGSGFLVLEADESDASFLHLKPQASIVTNIDLDHMATYNNSYENLLENFYEFLNKSSIETIFLCIDDKGCQDLLSKYSQLHSKKVITYGFSKEADINILAYEIKDNFNCFKVKFPSGEKLNFKTILPGKYNALNCSVAIACCKELGFDLKSLQTLLPEVQGVGRRFDIYKININEINIDAIDDYGHHPVEVSSCLQAVKDKYPNKKIIHIFQPHRYSRNKDLFDSWKAVLSTADNLFLLPTYAAGEEEILGATSKDLAEGLSNCLLVNDFEHVKEELKNIVDENSVILIQGAGDVTNLIDLLSNEK